LISCCNECCVLPERPFRIWKGLWNDCDCALEGYGIHFDVIVIKNHHAAVIGDGWFPSRTFSFAGEPVLDIKSQCGDEFLTMLTEKIQEIFNQTVPFEPTSDTNICARCPYHQMCRR
jgi:hypothetical protein